MPRSWISGATSKMNPGPEEDEQEVDESQLDQQDKGQNDSGPGVLSINEKSPDFGGFALG